MIKMIKIYTDGACSGNPGPGGWAALLNFKGNEKLVSGYVTNTTNSRMEMVAIIEGLKTLKKAPSKVEILTDSAFIVNAFKDRWMDKWDAGGWKTSKGEPVANQDLWFELLDLIKKHEVTFTWIKGHENDPGNERVNKEAQRQAQETKKSPAVDTNLKDIVSTLISLGYSGEIYNKETKTNVLFDKETEVHTKIDRGIY